MTAQNPTREELLAEGVRRRKAGKLDDALERMLELSQQYPDDAEVAYQTAWIHDRLGLGREALPYYRKALSSELSTDDRIGALIGCGSTLRVLGRYEDAVEVLETAVREYPENGAAQAFLAMALYNLAKHHDALSLVLRLVAATSGAPGVDTYRKAIEAYAEDLDGLHER